MAGGRSQRHMEEQGSIYPFNSSGEFAPIVATDITSKATGTSVSVATAANFTGEQFFSIDNPPEGCTIHATTGVVSGTSSAGAYTNVRVYVTNSQGVARTRKFTWTVT